jgi:general nucleoside transport system ATP-binding protein
MAKVPPLLAVQGLTKRFGALCANDGISLDIHAGEIHCILGENGAGKSTLSSCIYGLLRPDSGVISVEGRPVDLRNPADAIRAGIGMVHQHFVLVPDFTVAENILVGTGGPWRTGLAAARARIQALSARFGAEIDPDAMASALSVGARQWVEILKALYLGARVLILDEPTAVLTPQESERLFAVMRGLTAEGTAIVLITHKMDEVMQSDRVSVLRRGRHVATVDTRSVDRSELTRMMVGRDVAPQSAGEPRARGKTAVALRGVVIARGGGAPPIDLTVAEGEILGLAGIAGNGQDELLETLAGIRAPLAGRILLAGRDVTGHKAARIAAEGVGYIPSDRFRDGLVPDFTVAENLILGRHWARAWRRGPFLRASDIAARGREAVQSYSIAAGHAGLASARLSGGNAQKVILAREIAKATSLLLCNQPTRGIDVGAIEAVHGHILARRAQDCAVVMASEELDHLFALSDRIAVMFRGEIMGILPRGEFDEHRIGLMMAGERAAA